jgi:hypothetical protein
MSIRWSGETLWCFGHIEGAHGGAVTSDEEDGVTRLYRQWRGGSGGFNRDTGLWRAWWQVNWTEVERGGWIELELLTAAVASGGRRRTEGVLWCLREGRRGRGKLQDSQLLLPKVVAGSYMASAHGAVQGRRAMSGKLLCGMVERTESSTLQHFNMLHMLQH